MPEIKMASIPQKKFIKDLLGKKDISSLPQAQQDFFLSIPENERDEELSRLTSKQASNCIEALLECADKPKPAPPAPAPTPQANESTFAKGEGEMVPEGHFFIVDPTDGKEKFFHVNHGKVGTRWEGYAFLQVQASDFLYPVKSKEHREAVFAEILKDPVKAMNEYGMRLGRCGVCNRTLTDRDSRLRGIGPICAQNLGPSEEQLSILRKLGLVKDE